VTAYICAVPAWMIVVWIGAAFFTLVLWFCLGLSEAER